MSPMTFLQVASGIVALILAVSGALALVWALAKVKGVEASVGILNEANEGLRAANRDLVAQQARDREHFQLQLHQQEKDCTAAIASAERDCIAKVSKLEGQMEAVTGGLADKLVTAVLERASTLIATTRLSVGSPTPDE